MTSDPAAKDGSGHTPWNMDSFMPDEWGSFQFTTSADAKRAEHMFNQLSSDRDRLGERVKELEDQLTWCAEHNGECLGDHMQRLNTIRILLSKSPK